MGRGRRRGGSGGPWIAACALLFAMGCPETRPVLFVDLKTDLSLGVEFDWVEVELYRAANTSGPPDRTAPDVVAGRIEDAIAGVRLADFEDLSPGSWRVLVRLMQRAPGGGLEVVSGLRDVLVRSGERRAVTVLITRDCAGVVCPGDGDDPIHRACLGGRCVDPRCTPETREVCPPPECAADGECAPAVGGGECGEGTCLEGTCVTYLADARCLPEEQCRPERCVPREIPSIDAGVSADAGPIDAGPPTVDPCFESLGATCEVLAGSYLKASNTGAEDEFGFSVSLSGDTLAVGAHDEDGDASGVDGLDNDNAEDSGAVYVFVRDGSGTWSQQAYIKASNPGIRDGFGESISLSGDTLAVGASQEDSDATGIDGPDNDNALDSGAVYVFVRDGSGVWSQQAYLKASNTSVVDYFGHSVSLSGDTLAVGAHSEDSDATGVDGPDNDNASGSGAVYVFVRDGSSAWSQQAYLKASNTGAGDSFGRSVSLSGDTLAVGAIFEASDSTGVDGPDNDDAANSGAVYVFVRDGSGTWSQQTYLKASNTGVNDFFGESVSLSGDTLAVGAYQEDSDATGLDGPDNDNASDSGAVYVFVRDGSGAWSQQAYLKASNTGPGEWFGLSVSLFGNVLAVGAIGEDSDAMGVDGPVNDNTANAGAVYVFVRDGSGVWSQRAYLKASNTGSGDHFGYSVSSCGDALAVGAWREDSDATGVDGPDNNNATYAGAVYTFDARPL